MEHHYLVNPLRNNKERERFVCLTSFSLGIYSSSLTIPSLKRTDEGEYTCLTSNIIGHGQGSMHLRVQCKR